MPVTLTVPFIASYADLYNDAVLADNPFLYYKFNESVGATALADSSGNNRNATATASAGLGQPDIFGTSKAFGVQTSQNWITNATTSTSSVEGSIEFLYKASPTFAGSIVQHVSACNTPGWSWVIAQGFATSLTLKYGLGQTDDFYLPIPDDFNWHHYVITYDRGNNNLLEGYVDGVLERTKSTTAPAFIQDSNYVGGCTNTESNKAAGNNNVDAIIDNFAIYTTALTASQVSTHFNASGLTPFITAANTHQYWRWDILTVTGGASSASLTEIGIKSTNGGSTNIVTGVGGMGIGSTLSFQNYNPANVNSGWSNANKALDGSNANADSTLIAVGSLPANYIINTIQPIRMTEYTIYGRTDATDRNPRTWDFYYGDSSSGPWTLVHSQSEGAAWSGLKTFPVSY